MFGRKKKFYVENVPVTVNGVTRGTISLDKALTEHILAGQSYTFSTLVNSSGEVLCVALQPVFGVRE